MVIAATLELPELGLTRDDQLLELQRSLGEVRRRVDAAAAQVAAEVARRSRPELGHAGLAQRLGARTRRNSCSPLPARTGGTPTSRYALAR